MPAEPKWVDALPAPGGGETWMEILAPLVNAPGQWAIVREYDTAEGAYTAQSNLSRRHVNIPRPKDEWSFAAREGALYACYRGPIRQQRKKSSARVRRTQL
jgi:hypothetical protein